MFIAEDAGETRVFKDQADFYEWLANQDYEPEWTEVEASELEEEQGGRD